jgi:chromosome partitioning protein
MRTILVVNAKGGSGKTTLATNLAGYYAAEGAKVSLADFDPQGSSIDWLRSRPRTAPRIHGVEAHARGLRVPRSTEVVVMDAPAGAHTDALAALLRRAQTAIVPVVPSALDIRAAQRFFAEMRELRPMVQNDVRIATVATRVKESARQTEDLEDFLLDLKLPSGRRFPFLTWIRLSNHYLKAAEKGLSIFEFAPLATAADREYWQPLLRWLGSARSVPGES